MTKNMGSLDRTIRTLLALAVGVLWYTGKIGGTLAIVLGVFAVVFLLTSFVAWCPLYMPLKLSTRK
jgi:Inner membrane protein YgaP-like, transmembrane domain